MERSMEPAIVFSFSKRDVESFAKSVVTKYDLTTKDQKEKIAEIFEDAIAVLDEVDRDYITAIRDYYKAYEAEVEKLVNPLLTQFQWKDLEAIKKAIFIL